MKASLQSRVLALVGAGVFVAVGALALLSRSTLLSLEREVRHDHERLASTLARELSRAIGDDLRLVAGAAGVAVTDLPGALGTARRFGRLSSAAYAVDVNGILLGCEPAVECGSVRRDLMIDATRQATATGRPHVSDPVPHDDGRQRFAAVLPLRPAEGRPAAAVGVIIDPADRRLADLLDTSEIAPTLRVGLRDSRGAPIGRRAEPSGTAGYVSDAPISGTAWTLDLVDTGPDPAAPMMAFRRRSIWLVPTFAAIAMVLGWGIARSVRGPLVDLTAAAERIARGELSERIDTEGASSGGDEIARLAIALEHMRADLQSSLLSIAQTNEALEDRIEERTSELAAVNARLEQRERLRQTLLRQVISAQEDERRRVARELHDETSQTLAALGIGVDVALTACQHEGSGSLRARLEDVRGLVDRMHQELHRMIANLRPSLLDDLGLPAAVRWFVDRHIVPAGLTVRCEFSGLDDRLPPEIETAVFRAVQEALNNIVRHAQAETVLIQACADNGMLSVEIEDDGEGFDPGDVVRAPGSMRGIGLLGMRERMEILGGTATVDSAPGSGTRVVFTVPLVAVPAA